MDIISPVVGPIVEYTIDPIRRQFSYLFFIRQNLQNLKTQVEMLNHTKESVLHKVSEARRNAEDIESAVQNWLTRADSIIQKSEKLLNNLAQQGKLCLNLVQRHQVSRKAVKLAQEVVEIKNVGNFDRVSYRVALLEIESSKAKASDFLNFESRKPTIDKVVGALMDDKVNKIGVYGMGGVGKTMLVKEISRIVMEKNLFDEVVPSTVSQTPELKRIQGQLGDKLGLKFDQETEEGRALLLHKRLKMEQRILIVLDDVWKQIDLETIGIPSSEDHTGCKILFTSRDKSVLFNDMCTQENFEIKILQEDETWNLFKKMAGEIVETSDLKSVAIEIARECAHLPIAIITIAKALRNKHLSIWKDALDQLRNPVVVNIRGMNEKVYASLKLSYDQLDCKEAKLLFLLLSMFPEDAVINVEDLGRYAMGMGFLHGVDNLAQAQNRITKLVDDLISSSLLLEQSSYDRGLYVQMHDLIRDVAILISSTDDRICTLSYSKGFDELLQENKMSGNHTVAYLNVEGLYNLPQKLMLPKVQLLVLCGPLLDGHELPRTIFGEMKEMRFLEMEGMKIPHLSPLFYSLANLQSLHLVNCKLGNIDMIGELNKLENLSLKGSNIIQIPVTINQLVQLKVLNLSECHQLKIIPPNILLNLTKLEELYLASFDGWEREGLNKGRRNVSLSELSYLSDHLRALELCIRDEKVMPKQLFTRFFNLEKFNISIGCRPLGYCSKKISRVLCLKMETESGMDNEIKMLLKKSERLHLVGSISARVLPFELNENEFPHLKYLYIDDNLNFRDFNHNQNKPLQKDFPNLERLCLSNLKNLESIFDDNVREFPLTMLKDVKLLNCNKLGNLIFHSTVDDLLHLEKIKIINCEMMKAIIVVESEQTSDIIECPKLKYLKLKGLPQLQSFYTAREKLVSSETEESRYFNDDSFFNEKVSLPNLEKLTIIEAQNLKMICHNEHILNSFSNLQTIKIGKCNNLVKVFPSNIMSRLTCLTSLNISNCKLLEGVFELQEEPGVSTQKKDTDLLPKLRLLTLIELPKLQYICENDPWELRNFKEIKLLHIRDCPKLKTQYTVKNLRQLKSLHIDLSRLEETLKKLELDHLQTSKDGRELFPRLGTLLLNGSFDSRETHMPMEIGAILRNIHILCVRRTLFEEVFSMGVLKNVEKWHDRGSKLFLLSLCELPKLKHLWIEGLQNNSSILQNLKYLSVCECGILNMFVPSSMPFRHLSDLEVVKCQKLTFLLNPSVARSMGQLRILTIESCKRMTTVIARGVEEENDEILFNKLCSLHLRDLPELLSFYSEKCTIKFPALDNIILENCPEMKDFSMGIVSMPNLLTGNIGSYDCILVLNDYSREIVVEDINVTIRQVWENHYDVNLQYLFEVENLEENQLAVEES